MFGAEISHGLDGVNGNGDTVPSPWACFVTPDSVRFCTDPYIVPSREGQWPVVDCSQRPPPAKDEQGSTTLLLPGALLVSVSPH